MNLIELLITIGITVSTTLSLVSLVQSGYKNESERRVNFTVSVLSIVPTFLFIAGCLLSSWTTAVLVLIVQLFFQALIVGQYRRKI